MRMSKKIRRLPLKLNFERLHLKYMPKVETVTKGS